MAAAGIDSAQVDAELLAAGWVDREAGWRCWTCRALLISGPGTADLVDAWRLTDPLQHLTGLAPFGPLMLHVGRACSSPPGDRGDAGVVHESSCRRSSRIR